MDGSSGHILKILRHNSGTNRKMQKFLEDLLNLEMESPGWWNDKYKQIIDNHMKGGGNSEN